MIEQFYLNHRWDPNRYFHSGSERIRSTLTRSTLTKNDDNSKLQDWSLTIGRNFVSYLGYAVIFDSTDAHTSTSPPYIVIHRQICLFLSELISVARHTSFPWLESKPGWLKRQSKPLALSHEESVAAK